MQGLTDSLPLLRPRTGPASDLDKELHQFLICYEECFLLPKALRYSPRASISGPGERPSSCWMCDQTPPSAIIVQDGPHLSASTPHHFCCSLQLYILSKTRGAHEQAVREVLFWVASMCPC